ncbi:MAG TPA: heparinase II/III family protein, partial [Acidobacteriota bacterium]|nr:heparinase II/III family protein [Acidobacteriota bacterium]
MVAILLLTVCLLGSSLYAQQVPSRHLLSRPYLDRIEEILIPREEWAPFPTASQRDAWNSIPETVRKAHLRLGEEALTYRWDPLPASLFLEYARIGNRSNYERTRGNRRNRLADLVLAECIEGEGRFLDAIIDGIWVICEETYWGVPAHLGLQQAGPGLPDVEEPTVDLFAAETGALLAWTDYLLGPQLEQISPLVPRRIRLEVDRRILTPNLERDDFWWMGFGGRRVNNWNPWINSNWLTMVLLLEEDGARRVKSIKKILESLDQFINPYPEDGGCDEGPGYWGRAGASLFDCLELLYSATAGVLNIYDNPLVQDIGRYIYRAHIDGDYFINFADASGRVDVAADLIHRYGKRINDPLMISFGASAAVRQGYGTTAVTGNGSIGRQLAALFNLRELLATEPADPFLRDVWLPDLQVMAARSDGGTSKGFYVAAKGGHNAESHNHNDVGNFILYVDGQPAIVDAGVGTYTAQTFSSRRYEIWTMQSAFHNLPTIGGVMQKNGVDFAARQVSYQADDQQVEFSLDIAGAYPAEAGVGTWQRTIRLDRDSHVELVDQYQLNDPVNDLTLTLMTPGEVAAQNAGELVIQTAPSSSGSTSRLAVSFDGEKLSASTEEIKLEDGRLTRVWGSRLTRILLRVEEPSVKDSLTLIFKK